MLQRFHGSDPGLLPPLLSFPHPDCLVRKIMRPCVYKDWILLSRSDNPEEPCMPLFLSLFLAGPQQWGQPLQTLSEWVSDRIFTIGQTVVGVSLLVVAFSKWIHLNGQYIAEGRFAQVLQLFPYHVPSKKYNPREQWKHHRPLMRQAGWWGDHMYELFS